MRARQVGVVGVLLMGLCLAGRVAMAHTGMEALPIPGIKPSPASHPVAAQMLGLPFQFEANHGQVDDQVKFLARGKGYTLFLTPTESVMVLSQQEAKVPASDPSVTDPLMNTEPAPIKQSVVRMKLEGANPSPAVSGLEQLPGIVNYFIGNDPAKWQTKIPTYAKVHYKEAYPGIDLAYYGNQGKLEYDFIVAPGADPSQIKLAFEGASDIKVAESGDLLLTTALGDVRVQKPIVYQLEKDGHKTLVAGNYMISPKASSVVGVQLAAYDRTKPVVIDPVIVYSSFIGGAGTDNATDVTVDSSGNAFVVGWGSSLTFPILGAPYDSIFNGSNDVFILKVSPAGTLLAWTYLGSPSNDHTPAVALDGGGHVWVTGITGGAFPTTPGALRTTYAGGGDAFISKLDSNLSSLLYSTLYGSAGEEQSRSIAVDASGTIVHIAGSAGATSILPGVTPAAIQPTYGGGATDGFVAKINVALSQIVYATYLGGSDRDVLVKVQVDAAGYAHVVGRAVSTNFPGTRLSAIPALASFQPDYGGVVDAVVAKLNPTGTQLIYSTYLGGASDESGGGLVLDSAGNAVVSGNTGSSAFPLAGTPFQSTLTSHDYFVTKINASGTGLIYSTLFGGVGDDFGSVVALDQFDNIYLAGHSYSCRTPNFPHPLQYNYCGVTTGLVPQAFIAKLDAHGSTLLSLIPFLGEKGFSSSGASVISGIAGVAADTQGNVYAAGLTRATMFPTQNAFQETYGGGHEDGFVAKVSFKPLANAGPDQPVVTVPPAPPILTGTTVTLDGTASTGSSLTYNWTRIAGPSVALSGATTAQPTFTAPNVPAAGATVTFQLIVCEGTSSNCSDPDTVNVHISNINQPPVAQAGPDQTVQEGSPVMLDGTASYDPDIEPLTYTWLQVFGPPVTLAYPNTATPSFTAPSVGAGGAQVDFELIVTDARGLNHADYVSVFITNVNQPPTANAGADQTKNEQTLVTLDGSGSLDPDLDSLNYSWTQTGGPYVTLTGANTASPTFTAPNVAAGGAFLTFQLVVHDGQAGSVADTVQVAVVNVNDPPVCSLAQASPNLLWPPNHTMTQVSIVGLTDPQSQTLTITYPTVKQDEPINGLGDGDTSPDAAVSGSDILLRAERSGTGNGRVYVVQFTATNTDGAHCSGTVKVTVPHDKKDPAVEGPQLYNSFGP